MTDSGLSFKNGRFRVMLAGDPHENERLDTQLQRDKAQDYLDLQYAAVKELKPDLVVLLGDNATAPTTDALRGVLERITAPYRENGIPFAFVLGNHDLECAVDSLPVQYDIYRTLGGCLLPNEKEVNSFGDYNLTVKHSDGSGDALNLWFFYSGNKAEPKYNSYYDFVKPAQLDAYREKAAALAEKNGGTVPAVAFQHIPVPEEYRLLKKTDAFSLLFDGVRGQNGQKNSYYRLGKDAKGYMGEGICPPDYNGGEFDAWKETGDIFAAFFGHDHLNDFVGKVDGITLGQCKLAGFRQYGDGLRQGVRVLDFKEDDVRGFETRMVTYRQLIGRKCRSIHGLDLLPDRITVKLDVLKKIASAAACVAAVITAKACLKKRK